MKIICIGRNYIDHAKELNNPVPDEPVFFLKPETALIPKNQAFYYPDFSNDVHYEVELVVRIDKVGKNISKKFAHKYYSSIGVGIDFTARDIQQKCKEKGLPWEKAKAFDGSAPVSKFVSLGDLQEKDDISFGLEINGKKVQEGKSSHMLFSIDYIISYISQYITLKIGDLIFTGTPAGVGKVNVGDQLTAFIEERKMLQLKVR